MSRAGTLVLLNGTSSSGKSTLLNEFQKTHPNFKIFRIDDWHGDEIVSKAKSLGWREETLEHPWLLLTKYVEGKTGRPNFDSETRAYFFREAPSMYTEAKRALESGANVLLDTVFEYDPEYDRFRNFFAGFAVIKVLVYCRLDVLLARVHKRNKSGAQAEIRTAFLSFEQFPAMYKLQEHPQELVVDTVSARSMKTALTTAIQNLVDNHIPEKFLPRLTTFEFEFTNRFELDSRRDVTLVTRHPYDLILDSSSQTPQELARAIASLSRTGQ